MVHYSFQFNGSTTGFRGFKSKRGDFTHAVVNSEGQVMARCSSLELAERAKAKDERLYNIDGLSIVPVSVK